MEICLQQNKETESTEPNNKQVRFSVIKCDFIYWDSFQMHYICAASERRYSLFKLGTDLADNLQSLAFHFRVNARNLRVKGHKPRVYN